MKKTTQTDSKKVENRDILSIYIGQIKMHPLLAFSEEKELSYLVQQGDKGAIDKLVKANLRLVLKIARPYVSYDTPLLDLIQEGNLGLMHAAKKYDYKRNVRFCTYASWWIRQHILRYLSNKQRFVKLPHRKEQIIRKYQKTYHTLSQNLMHQPKAKDIADELGVSLKEINYIINFNTGPIPLELVLSKGNSANAIDFHEDYTYNPEINLFKKYHRDTTIQFLDKLKEREKQVIKYRFLPDDGKPHTLKEIGKKMRLSAETIRQIELKALAKLRNHKGEIRKHGLLQAI